MPDSRAKDRRSSFLPDGLLEARGDNDFDLVVGPIRVELSRSTDGGWQFWNVEIKGERFGGTQYLSPGPLVDWLEEQADA